MKKRPDHILNNPIYNTVWNRIYKYNQNFLCSFIGQTGSAKSWSAMKFGYDLDRNPNTFKPRFTIDRTVFTPEDFLELVRSKDLKRGSAIVWDEIGVGANSRQWYSLKNQLISYVTQTFRFKNLIVLYTVPSFNMIDSQIRGLFHGVCEMKGSNPDEGTATGVFKWVSSNPTTGKLYFPKPRVITPQGRAIISELKFRRAPKDLLQAYEAKKAGVADQWYAKYNKQLQYMEEFFGQSVDNEKIKIADLYKEIKKAPEKFLDEKGMWSRAAVMAEFDIGRTTAYEVVHLLKLRQRQGDIQA